MGGIAAATFLAVLGVGAALLGGNTHLSSDDDEDDGDNYYDV